MGGLRIFTVSIGQLLVTEKTTMELKLNWHTECSVSLGNEIRQLSECNGKVTKTCLFNYYMSLTKR